MMKFQFQPGIVIENVNAQRIRLNDETKGLTRLSETQIKDSKKFSMFEKRSKTRQD